MFSLKPPRHISTLPYATFASRPLLKQDRTQPAEMRSAFAEPRQEHLPKMVGV
jgi:hypothetical protein